MKREVWSGDLMRGEPVEEGRIWEENINNDL
jgi:hypothetical protein